MGSEMCIRDRMIIEALQNPHYIIDFNSYEGLRNISITAFLFVSILILGRNLNKSKNIFFLKLISLIALSQTGYDHIIDIMNDNWNLEEDLPLHLCSFSNLIVISILFIKPNKKVCYKIANIREIKSVLKTDKECYNEGKHDDVSYAHNTLGKHRLYTCLLYTSPSPRDS